jgi:hypothetical protein
MVASSLLDPGAGGVRLGVVSEREGSRRLPPARFHARHTPGHDVRREASAASMAFGSVPDLTQGLALGTS